MIKQTLADATPEQIMIAIGQSGVHPEGRFFPDTYRFPKDTSDLTLLKQAYATMSKALRDEWAQRAPDLPYDSPDEALTMASIIEKATGQPARSEEQTSERQSLMRI